MTKLFCTALGSMIFVGLFPELFASPSNHAPTRIEDSTYVYHEDRLADVQVPPLIARGQRVAAINGCTDCHGEDLSGTNFLEAMPFADLPAPNLTGQAYSEEQLRQAIRDGIGADGRALIIMPSTAFARMNDSDLDALVAFIQSRPRLDSDLMDRRIGQVGRVATAMRASELVADRRERIGAEGTSDGQYLTRLCMYCHGTDFGGAPVPGDRNRWAPNLTPHVTGLGGWTYEDFVIALREGWSRSRGSLDDTMPWKGFQSFTDDEIRTIWDYLRALTPVERIVPAEELD